MTNRIETGGMKSQRDSTNNSGGTVVYGKPEIVPFNRQYPLNVLTVPVTIKELLGKTKRRKGGVK